MKKTSWEAISMKNSLTLLVIATLLISIFGFSINIKPTQAQYDTVIKVIPDTIEFDAGAGDVVGQEFMIAVVVENVTNLVALDVQFSWNTTTTYLEYINHTRTITVEDYPDPIPPSPYPGIIHTTTTVFDLKDAVDPPELGSGTYWAAYAQISPMIGFNGSGTVFVMAFRITTQPLPGGADVTLNFDILVHDISDPYATPILHDAFGGTVVILAPPLSYPPWPLLKILPEDISDVRLGNSFDINVTLMGDNHTDLNPFWDVAGIDVFVNFNNTLLEAVATVIDPDGWFASFWPTIWITANEINNTAGTVRVSFFGYGTGHTPPSGQGRLFTVTFNATYESDTSPPPSAPITLQNPIAYTGSYGFDAVAGLIDVSAPVGTEWHELYPSFYTGPFELSSWEDDGDGVLGPGDRIILTDPATGFYFSYNVNTANGTLGLTQQPFYAGVWEGYAMDGPVNAYTPWEKLWTTPASHGHLGNPNMFGNFSLPYPVSSINYFAVYPQFGAPYNLTEGVDFTVYPDGVVELLYSLDERVENEYIGNMTMVYDNGMQGWPGIGGVDNWYNIVASGFESVYVDFNNGTARYAVHTAAEALPPNEYWYDDWFPYELESWYATGYFADPSWTWPNATDIWINYTAPAWVEIDYNAMPDPQQRYIESNDDYAGFITMGDPIGSEWKEAFPRSWREYTIVGWIDGDTSVNVTAGDYIDTMEAEGNRTYLIESVATDINLSKGSWICEENVVDPFFGVAPIINLAGYPHPERDYCPWHSHEYSVPLPHKVENALYTAALTLQPPVANFTYTPPAPIEFDPVAFDASLSYDPDGYITDYFWDFGDGTNATTITANHTFGQGIHNVTLTVTDNDTLTGSYWQLINVQRVYPVAYFDFTPTEPVETDTVSFNATQSYHPHSSRTIVSYIWDFDDGTPQVNETQPIVTHTFVDPGFYNVSLTVVDNYGIANSVWFSRLVTVEEWQMNLIWVEVDVGEIYFPGEMNAEFYILVHNAGIPVNATDISATLYFNGTTLVNFLPSEIDHIATGLYLIHYDVPPSATAGQYTLHVKAQYYDLYGTNIAGFLVSSTLTTWNARLIAIENDILTIQTDIGTIQIGLNSINATLIAVQGDVATIQTDIGTIKADINTIKATLIDVNGTIVTIQTTLGTITTTLDAIDAEVTDIAGDVVTINTTLGTITTSIEDLQTTVDEVHSAIGGLQSTVTIGLAVAAVFSAIAAIVAILILLMLRKK